MKKRFGFTLAEVLITLGIIGVVAAMTVPTLIQNTNSVKFAAQFKKSISTLSQAAMMAQAQYDVDFGLTTAACNETKATAAGENLGGATPTLSFCSIFNSTLAGKTYNGTDAKDGKTGANYSWVSVTTLGQLSDYYVYTLADGSLFGFKKTAKGCSINVGESVDSTTLGTSGKLKDCIGFIDANGTSVPNTEVKCEGTTTTSLDPSTVCGVTSGSGLGDIFPVVFHDGVVEPATNASKAVFTRGK